jgi:Cdc6-like AAA superfamily ATPase
MDLKERIARRQHRDDDAAPVVEYGSLSPATHPEEPENRGRVLERLLDALDPVFGGALPDDVYVHGPHGAGKTAVVRALFGGLGRHLSPVGDQIVTSTRVETTAAPEFVYVDGRQATSEFALYRVVLGSLLEEEVPGGGVGTDQLRQRLEAALSSSGRSTVVAVDHLGEPRTMDVPALRSALAPVADDVAWVGVGTTPADELAAPPGRTVSVPAYEHHALEDVLSARASRGLSSTALGHERLRRIATWADGDAHDALAALCGAASLAADDGEDSVGEAHVEAGIDAVPVDGVPIGMVLALPENRRTILRALIDLDPGECGAVGETATAIAGRPAVDLSEGTVTRFLYELADWGVLERVAVDAAGNDHGRPPSRVESRFPTLVFRRLADLADDDGRG